MKMLHALMLLYQYAYYWNIQWDKHAWPGMSKSVSKIKAFVAFFAVESWFLFAVYIFLVNVMLGHPIHQGVAFPIIAFVVYFLIVNYAHELILGPEERREYYREIFDSWNKKKRARWNFVLILIVALSFCALNLALEASRKMVQP